MDEKNDADKNIDDVMLPGFRFHPTDEELVGFYLKWKIQQRPLPIELIKQVDIYKYDPWDLPKLASTGEKEWYFYCPRDRKYRNSARPNRVTGAGFWKATGTDRPIYSSDGTKCIGLKKSLVFYRGRAAKGIKTDWMMHEFRLPSSISADSAPPKKLLDKNLPPNDSWAICRIFKKTNSMAQRALSHSWVSPILPDTTASDVFNQGSYSTQFNSENMIYCTTETALAQQASTASFSDIDHHLPSYKQPMNPTVCKQPSPFSISNGYLPNGFNMLSPLEMSIPTTKCTVDVASMLFNSMTSESIDFEGPQHQFNSFSMSSPQDMQGSTGTGTGIGEDNEGGLRKNPSVNNQCQWGNLRSIGFPFSLASSDQPNLPWDSPSPPCPSEMSTTYSTNKSYT